MSSGDVLFELLPSGGGPPGTVFATFDTVADASTPTIILPVYDFDDQYPKMPGNI